MSFDTYLDRQLDDHFDRQHDCESEGHVWGRTRNLRTGMVTQCEICGEEDGEPCEPNEDL